MERLPLQSVHPREKIPILDFNEQFVKQTVSAEGHTFEFVKVIPKEIISERYVIYIGGLGSGAEAYRSEIENLAQSGRKVFFINPTKGIQASETDAEAMQTFNMPVTIQMKTAEVLKVLELANIHRADIVGYSQGAVVSAMVATMRPGIAEDLVLVNPAGMYGADTHGALLGRILKGGFVQQVENIKRALNTKGEASRIGHVVRSVVAGDEKLKDPIWRFNQEMPGVANSNTVPVLQSLKEYQVGQREEAKTKITLVTANGDVAFPPKKIEENVGLDVDVPESGEILFREVVDSYAMYADKHAGHEAPMYEKPGLIAGIVNEKIYQLNSEVNDLNGEIK